MRRFFATAVSIGLVGFCIAAHSSPLIIQPSQEFPYNEGGLGQGGWGGVALRGSFLLAGNSGGDQYPPVTGVVNIYRKVDDARCNVSPCWIEERQFQRPDAVPGDSFGISMDFDGQTLVIGSPAFDTNPGTSSTIDYAAAYIYERDGDRFIFKQKLQGVPIPANPGGLSHFGMTTVLSGDRLAITQLPEFVSGSAYVFKRDERGVWHQEAQLQPAAVTGQFGISVDLTRDTLISGSDTAGYATLFYRKGADWTEGPTLTAPDQAWNGGGGFGRSVTFDGDDKVAVGAYVSSDPNYVNYVGSEYLFKRDGKDWIQQSQIVDPDFAPNDFPMFGAQSKFRGGRLAIASTEGIYLYEHQDKQWVWVAKLVLPSPEYFVLDNSLESLDLNATTVVATTITGIAIFDISALDAKPAVTAP